MIKMLVSYNNCHNYKKSQFLSIQKVNLTLGNLTIYLKQGNKRILSFDELGS